MCEPVGLLQNKGQLTVLHGVRGGGGGVAGVDGDQCAGYGTSIDHGGRSVSARAEKVPYRRV